MENEKLSLEEMQELVSKLVNKYNLETIPEIRYIDLTSEMGELGKELLKGTNYGKQEFEKTDNLESEIGDTLFSLVCIANSLNINLAKTLMEVIAKYESRFEKKGNIGSGR